MPAEEAVSVEESFEMLMPVMAKIGKATKVHGNSLCSFELAVISSLFGFDISSPHAILLSMRLHWYTADF